MPCSRALIAATLLAALCVLGPAQAQTRTLYLVRHGAYDEAAADNAHAPLIALGIAQARRVAARLAALPDAPAVLVTSTMTRAEQTAAIIHAALPAVPLQHADDLRECTPPVAADTPVPGLDAKAAQNCQQQIDRAFAMYFRPAAQDESDILVAHGNVIRGLTVRALGIDPKLWLHFSIGHTSITEIQIHADGGMRVIAVGDVGHLPPAMQSGAVAAPARPPG